MTLDGKIATRSGDSKWISNEASRRTVHELRGRMDAIVVGIGTALADDPLLTARPPGPRVPTRHSRQPRSLAGHFSACADRQGSTDASGGVFWCDRKQAGSVTCCRLPDFASARKCRGERRPTTSIGTFGSIGTTNVLVEGGAEVFGSFLDLGAIDEAHVFIAPFLLGGCESKTAVAGRGSEQIAAGLRLTTTEVKLLDGDVYVRGWREVTSRSA